MENLSPDCKNSPADELGLDSYLLDGYIQMMRFILQVSLRNVRQSFIKKTISKIDLVSGISCFSISMRTNFIRFKILNS